MDVLIIIASLATFLFLPQVFDFLGDTLEFTGLMLGVMFYSMMLMFAIKHYDRITSQIQERRENTCPSCKKTDAIIRENEIISRHEYSAPIYSKDYDDAGNVIGASPSGFYKTKEFIRGISKKRCKYCGHEESKFYETSY